MVISWNGAFILISSTGGCIQHGLQGQTSVLAVGIIADSVASGALRRFWFAPAAILLPQL